MLQIYKKISILQNITEIFFRLTIKSAPLFLYIFLQIRVNWAERTLKDVKKGFPVMYSKFELSK